MVTSNSYIDNHLKLVSEPTKMFKDVANETGRTCVDLWGTK